MKLCTVTAILWAALTAGVMAEPKSQSAKTLKYGVKDNVNNVGLYRFDKEPKLIDSTETNGSSSGRLFLKRFFFKKMFGEKPIQPIIPIIITGVNSGSGTNVDETPITTPIDTDTNTETEPVATGTVETNSPEDPDDAEDSEAPVAPEDPDNAEDPADPADAEDPADPVDAEDPADPVAPEDSGTAEVPINTADPPDGSATSPVDPAGSIRLQRIGLKNGNPNKMYQYVAVIDEPSYTGVAQKYIVRNQGLKNSYNDNAKRAPARINLRIRGSRPGQLINVRLPAKYSGNFKHGQRVILNKPKRTRPVKRRVIRRRKNRRGTNKNKNKRRRIIYV